MVLEQPPASRPERYPMAAYLLLPVYGRSFLSTDLYINRVLCKSPGITISVHSHVVSPYSCSNAVLRRHSYRPHTEQMDVRYEHRRRLTSELIPSGVIRGIELFSSVHCHRRRRTFLRSGCPIHRVA